MRSFNRKEIKSILAKAAELEMSKGFNDQTESLTEQEILELAKESGISASSIQSALSNYNIPEFETEFNWLKGTTKIQHLETFDVELKSEHLAKVLRMIQANENELGEAELSPKHLEWELKKEIESTKVKVYEDNGKAAFEYSNDWTALKFVMATFPFLILFVITLVTTKGMGFDKFTSLMIAPFGGLLGLAGGWMYLKSKFENQKNRLHETINQLRSLFIHEELEKPRIKIEEELNTTEPEEINKTRVRP